MRVRLWSRHRIVPELVLLLRFCGWGTWGGQPCCALLSVLAGVLLQYGVAFGVTASVS